MALAAGLMLSACATPVSTVAGDPATAGRTLAEHSVSALAFAPLSGPPRPVADALAKSFADAAVARSLRLAPYRRRKSAYVIKGFISVTPGENGTIAVYVWDVLSPELKRLHRISGQVTEKATAD